MMTHGSLLGSLGRLPLLASTLVPLQRPLLPQSLVRLELLLLVRDRSGLLGGGRRRQSGESAGDVGSQVLALSIASLGLAGLAGEDNEAGAVVLQTVDVDGLRLLRLVAAAVVNRDTETLGLLPADAGELELGKSEATALWSGSAMPHILRIHLAPSPSATKACSVPSVLYSIVRIHVQCSQPPKKNPDSPLMRMLYR